MAPTSVPKGPPGSWAKPASNKPNKHRYDPLIIQGDSRNAKTSYARSLFPNETLTVVVRDAVEPSLRDFREGHNKCIVFDQVDRF